MAVLNGNNVVVLSKTKVRNIITHLLDAQQLHQLKADAKKRNECKALEVKQHLARTDSIGELIEELHRASIT